MDTLKKAMIQSLTQHYGNVSKSVEAVGCARSTHYLWMDTDPEYKQAVEDINDFVIDHVEDKLHEKINGVTISKGVDEDGKLKIYEVPPSDTAIIFFLKTRAKKRGYVEKNELDVSGGLGITWNEQKTYDSNEEADKGD